MSIEARQIQKTLYSYAAILKFTPSPQGLRAKFEACSIQNAQLFMYCQRSLGISLFCTWVKLHDNLASITYSKMA